MSLSPATVQSSWHTLDHANLLKEEILTVRELLEIEPDSKCKFFFIWIVNCRYMCYHTNKPCLLFLFNNNMTTGALQTLAHFIEQLRLLDGREKSNEALEEVITIYEKLIKLDTYRRHRYQDASKLLCIIFTSFPPFFKDWRWTT